jgi:CheY-like chemotaxis protein
VPTGVTLVLSDITELKNARGRLDLAMESARIVWWDWDIAGGRFDTHAAGWCILGYPHDELRRGAEEWFELVHPDDRVEVRRSLDAALEGHAARWECAHRFRNHAGGWSQVLNMGVVTERAEGGRPLRMIGTTQNISKLGDGSIRLDTGALVAAAATVGTPPPAPLPAPQSARLVAVVEAEADVAERVARHLRGCGHAAEIFHRAAQCLERVRARPTMYSAIVTAQALPQMTGLELVRALRRDGLRLPVVLAASDERTRQTEELPRLRPLRFLAKPYAGEELAAMLATALADAEQASAAK